jgi:hypothetical protein
LTFSAVAQQRVPAAALVALPVVQQLMIELVAPTAAAKQIEPEEERQPSSSSD